MSLCGPSLFQRWLAKLTAKGAMTSVTCLMTRHCYRQLSLTFKMSPTIEVGKKPQSRGQGMREKLLLHEWHTERIKNMMIW